jgi:ubiquinone/menaquinone biosynthesis C-methylase UbiE
MIHDLRHGIPFATESVDVVYHSHLIEHIDFEHVNQFLQEIRRVLKIGGIQRLVIPDLEHHIFRIQDDIRKYEATGIFNGAAQNIYNLFEQSVRKKPAAIMNLRSIVQRLTIGLLGDAQSRGETHQMMYTKAAIHEILIQNGFANIRFVSSELSQIPDWHLMNMDLDPQGTELHKGSVYIECQRI